MQRCLPDMAQILELCHHVCAYAHAIAIPALASSILTCSMCDPSDAPCLTPAVYLRLIFAVLLVCYCTRSQICAINDLRVERSHQLWLCQALAVSWLPSPL